MTATLPSVLVVDDELDTCRNLADIFTDLGYRVETAQDGASAAGKTARRSIRPGRPGPDDARDGWIGRLSGDPAAASGDGGRSGHGVSATIRGPRPV